MRRMAINWNEGQRHAIEGRDGTMLVSAAAGSGKTAVLVERVIQRLCDEKNPCSIDELLIVTFTRAAAAQMKEKISEALAKKIAENPDNTELKKCRFMMPYANIGTIDSFCINLVRNNFHRLDISPDFGILDNSKISILEETAVMSVIERYHTEKSEEFRYLNELINDNKDDKIIKNLIKDIRRMSRAYEFPDEWLESLYKDYQQDTPVFETSWGKILIQEASDYIDDTLKKIDYCLEEIKKEPVVFDKYYTVFEEDKGFFEKVKTSLLYENWDRIYETALNCEFKKGIRISKYESRLLDYCKLVRSYSLKEKSLLSHFKNFSITEEEFNETRRILAPAIKTLVEAVRDYDSELRRLKDEENAYSFDDTLHFALDLLIEKKGDETVRTEFAKQISENYKEILVDEYQDVSKAQDSIFSALSKNNTNRFMVGDVKQSIYSFRQAMPDVFINLRKGMTPYDGIHYPAREALSSNYRSRKGVTEAVNFVFSQLMSEGAGGVEYDKNEALNPEAKFPESDTPDFNAVLFETDKGVIPQAEYIASYITNAVENGMNITDKSGNFRGATYGDFCILYRSGKCCKTFTDVLEKAGIPYSADNEDAFLSSPEISFIISLLKVIDNPINDIPLTAVLMSPVYGFTPDEMAQLRIDSRRGNIYTCLVRSAKNGNEKASGFFKEIEKLRRVAITLTAGEFTSRIIDETGYRAIVSAMKGGEERLANLNAFIHLAGKYEQTGIKGISAFLRYLDKLGDNDEKSKSRKSDASDSVKLMTIHKSKGLEFPVVFLVNCEKNYNNQDLKENIIISKDCGIGLKLRVDNIRYDTLQHIAAKAAKSAEIASEELRILYVAMTRPKEKLIVLASAKDWSKKLSSYSANSVKGENPTPATVIKINNYAELLLTAFLKHPDAHLLRERAGIETTLHDECEGRAAFEIINPVDAEETQVTEITEEYTYDPEMLDEIKSRLSYEYPFRELNGVAGKQIASKLETEKVNKKFYASSKPAYRSKTGLTAAQKGIATHRFMQYSDYARAKQNVEAELERLVENQLLTQQEADSVDADAIKKFFSSDIADRMIKAQRIYKEYSFTSSLPVWELYPDTDKNKTKNEVIIIEGVVDCAFEEDGKLIILDFKTDKAKNSEELKENYGGQLGTYKKCMARVSGKEVSETIIYSFHLGKEIKL